MGKGGEDQQVVVVDFLLPDFAFSADFIVAKMVGIKIFAQEIIVSTAIRVANKANIAEATHKAIFLHSAF